MLVALEKECFFNNDLCGTIHFVATLQLQFGTTGLRVVHSSVFFLVALQLSVCSIYCALGHSCSPKYVCPAALRGVCPSLAPQPEPLHSPTAACTPSARMVFLGMLEIEFMLLLIPFLLSMTT